MVDPPDPPCTVLKHVAALSIGVVDQDVQNGHADHIIFVLVHEVEVVAALFGVNEELDRTHPVRAIANDSWWNEVPTQSRANHPGKVLTDV